MVISILSKLSFGVCSSWMWRQGGKTNKLWRKVGLPLVSYLYTRNFTVSIMIGLVSTLPITLIENDLKIKGQVYWWVPILCLVHSIPVYLCSGIWVALSLFVLQVGMIQGSCLVNFPKWNWYEKIYGFLLGISLH